jgi:alpha-glucuronidase
MLRTFTRLAFGTLTGLSLAFVAAAQTPAPSAVGWLRYVIPPDPPRYHDMPRVVSLLGDENFQPAPEEEMAAEELDRGLGHMVAGTDILLHRIDPRADAIILGTPAALRRAHISSIARGWIDKPVPEEGFRIVHLRNGIRQWWVLEGGSPRAELYAAFRFAAMVAEDRQLPEELAESPRLPLRAIQLEGEAPETTQLHQYGRLFASVGINGVILSANTQQVTEAQRTLRPFGIRVFSSEQQLEANSNVHLQDATFRDAPLSGLVAPLSSPTGKHALRYALLPGGLRQPVTPLHAWQSTLRNHNQENVSGALGVLPQEAVLPMLDQPLYQASLYAFGRFAWNPAESRDSILDQWARQTWGDDARIYAVAKKIVLDGEASYTGLTSPLGLPRLGTDRGPDPMLAGGSHPLADHEGIGADRLHSADFPASFRNEYATPTGTPAEWLLLLHRVPLHFRLRDGLTVTQAVYDATFTGASTAANADDAWDETRDLLEPERWMPVHLLLQDSARRAEIWREAVTDWLLRVTGVPDTLGFAGKHAGRIEAESMALTGYREVLTEEKEAASGGTYVACALSDCAASTEFRGEANVYRIEVGYFDASTTPKRFVLRVNGAVVDTWMSMPRGATPGGISAERFVRNGVRLKPGDRVEVHSSGPLDFVEITRDPRWN